MQKTTGKTVCLNDELLMNVTKPARYLGGELNMVIKDPLMADCRFALCFPDIYEIGMSHLGLQILYYFLNRRNDTYCERVFAPWVDMEEKMRELDMPLFSLETKTSVTEFDIIGFTLQYEMSYTNIINMINLSNIPIFSKDRDLGLDSPIICAGGPSACNPEPLADIIDFFYIGEGEVTLNKVLDCYIDTKKNGGNKIDFLKEIATIEGIYVPQFYDVTYDENGIISSFDKNYNLAPDVINRVFVKDLENVYFPEAQLVPNIEIVHDRVTLEVFRGCIRGCRFCQAGFIYRPQREKGNERLFSQSKELFENSGHDEISLVSLSTGDYSEFKLLADKLIDYFSCKHVNVSLPSLRIDAMNMEILEKVQAIRKSSLTFAPEAGSQRLRDVINKNLSQEEIINGCRLAFDGGWDKIKLYFMIGLPTETEEDILAIPDLGDKIVNEYYKLPKEKRSRPVSISMSASCFVPKPFTPFQWEAQNSFSEFAEKGRLIKKSIHKKQIRFSFHDEYVSVLEGALARGDRKISRAIFRAWELGARFDGWSERFDYKKWVQAFEDTGLSIDFYAARQREYSEILPWDHINTGVSKKFLIAEMEKAKESKTTPDCRSKCSVCGIGCRNGRVGEYE